MKNISKYYKLIDEGFSLLTVGENKAPNFSWKKNQEEALTKSQFEQRLAYQGGKYKKDGREIHKTNGVGIITGYNDLEVIDVDLKVFSTARERKDFWDEYLSFLKDNILDFEDKFIITKTKNAGYHIIYKSKRVVGNKKIAKLKGHREQVIESRGIGGYVFVYNDFINGKYYTDVDYISDEDREILWAASEMYNYEEPKIEAPPKKTVTKYTQQDGVTPWDDFNAKNSVYDVVSDEFAIVAKLRDRLVIKRHGAKSAHSGYIFHDNGCMYLHTTGTQYDNEKQYTPYSAYVKKHFNNDFSAAAKKLYAEGYGSRIKQKKPDPIIEKKQEIKEDDFPIDIFPKEFQHYILECESKLGSVVDYMGCSLLWVVSVIIGNSVQVKIKNGWLEKATIWLAAVGKAGLGKTPSIKNIIFPLEKANGKEIKRYIEHRQKYEHYKELSNEEKKTSEEIHEPKKTQFIANDITLEALVDLHQNNINSVGVFKDELAGWFKDMNKYREGSDLEFWLSTWSGSSVHVNRMTRAGSFVENPHIPVLGGIQPNVLSGLYTQDNKDNGFIDRMLLTFPDTEAKYYNENEIDEGLLQWYSNEIVRFYEQVKEHVHIDEFGNIVPTILEFSADAKVEWMRIDKWLVDNLNSHDENEYIKSMYPKQKSYIPRFALLIQCLSIAFEDGSTAEITKDSLLKAEKLSKYFISMAKKIKITAQESSDIRLVVNKNKLDSNYEKIKALYEKDKDFNRTEASNILGISRQTTHRYVAKIEEELNKK